MFIIREKKEIRKEILLITRKLFISSEVWGNCVWRININDLPPRTLINTKIKYQSIRAYGTCRIFPIAKFPPSCLRIRKFDQLCNEIYLIFHSSVSSRWSSLMLLVTCFVHVLANNLIKQSTPLLNRRLLNWYTAMLCSAKLVHPGETMIWSNYWNLFPKSIPFQSE